MTTPRHAQSSTPPSENDSRLEQLQIWVRRVLARSDLSITTASADASFRRYFRVAEGSGSARQTWVVMDAPPDKEDVQPYIKVAQMLIEAGVNAPRVLAQNQAEGFLLLSDLGNRTYLTDLVNGERVDELYRDALSTLVQMQCGCQQVEKLPPYDTVLLRREMDLFPEWFLAKHLGVPLDDNTREMLESVFAFLIESALSQPRVFVHRDYHSRNLMITDGAVFGPNPGVLDFQDAVHGPIAYDLVSLLRDCYIAWPRDRVHGWVREYRALAKNAGLTAGKSDAELLRWFDLIGVQRHLKVLGIFSRLWHRDGKQGYLSDIPRTLDYVRAVIGAYPELQPLAQLIDTLILPALARP